MYFSLNKQSLSCNIAGAAIAVGMIFPLAASADNKGHNKNHNKNFHERRRMSQTVAVYTDRYGTHWNTGITVKQLNLLLRLQKYDNRRADAGADAMCSCTDGSCTDTPTPTGTGIDTASTITLTDSGICSATTSTSMAGADESFAALRKAMADQSQIGGVCSIVIPGGAACPLRNFNNTKPCCDPGSAVSARCTVITGVDTGNCVAGVGGHVRANCCSGAECNFGGTTNQTCQGYCIDSADGKTSVTTCGSATGGTTICGGTCQAAH